MSDRKSGRNKGRWENARPQCEALAGRGVERHLRLELVAAGAGRDCERVELESAGGRAG